MLLTVTSTAVQATDLGFLLHKHPGKVQSFELSVGTAHVFYPEVSDERCTAALLLEVDPIALVRGRSGEHRSGFSLAQYVNDRPYAASSMLAVALGRVFRTAIAGRCEARPDLPGREIPLEIHAPAVPCRGGGTVAEQMFGPLGWQVEATPVQLDPERPGGTPGTSTFASPARCDSPTRSATCTSCSPSWTPTSTTGWGTTRSTS